MTTRTRATESLRRIYGELVRGRTRVRVVTADHHGSNHTVPRFLLAPYRSGTTLLRFCLDSHPDLAVPPESDYLVPLLSLVRDEPGIAGLNDLGFAGEDVTSRLHGFARSFLDIYADGRGAGLGWLDKSPRYAEDPLLIADVFPNARLLVMHRHPLDQIHSFTRGGTFAHPTLGVDSRGAELVCRAAEYWLQCTRALETVAAAEPDRSLVLTYEQLCENPRSTLEEVLDHLQLPWSEDVLEYHRFDHDLGSEAGRVSGTKGFHVSRGAWTSWPAKWVELCWDIVGSAASSHGYRLDAP